MENGLENGKIHLPVFLFPPISWWKDFLSAREVVLVKNENWVKQSFRNRFEIYGPNNRQRISVPIDSSTKHGPLSKVKLDHTQNWGKLNWRSLVTAYNKSPFFEFYDYQIEPLFSKKNENLLDYSYESVQLCAKLLDFEDKIVLKNIDYNNSKNNFCAKNYKIFSNTEYSQVFEDRNGFQENLSVLDLLFNLGPEASTYLKNL